MHIASSCLVFGWWSSQNEEEVENVRQIITVDV